ncbi:MAG TPA: putative sulfate exporter family transporter [Candidatus Ozemobacteraceae bacterium]|nr:putative sulfate exporter family transporter [Candidatus Ozemobacteraceae bacterium]
MIPPALRRVAFVALPVLCLIPGVTPAMALAAGILFSLTLDNPYPGETARWSKGLLQFSVVALGFGIPLSRILTQAWDTLPVTIAGITLTILLGMKLGTLLGVGRNTAALVSFGTAICGGSAIAAMAPTIKAKNDEIAVSLVTVFLLNAVALVVFPFVGRMLGLTEHAFGIWAGLAIHDTSSVVGAASSYGAAALAVATSVKLARALWITPCVLVAGWLTRSEGTASVPLFIIGFIAAAIIRSAFPAGNAAWDMLAGVGRRLLVVTLFLVGAGLSRETMARAGMRPMIQGLGLWVTVSLATLAVIRAGLV